MTQLEQRSVASSTWDYNRNNTDTTAVVIEKKYEDLVQQVALLKGHVSELEQQLQASLASTHNGVLLWRIPELARRKRNAIEEKVTSLYSPPFYTARGGYKMCIVLTSTEMGLATRHISLYFLSY